MVHDNYSDIVTPLTRLTRKGTAWSFSDSCCSAFRKLKDAFTPAPILTHWSPDALMIVETDASDYAIASILSLSIVLMTRSGWWLTIHGLCPLQSSTMMSTTRSSLLSMRCSSCGVTTSRAPLLQLMWSLTTKTWSTLRLPSS